MPAGRPTKYKPEHCDTVIDIMSEGASKAECCAKLGIWPSTFIDWQKENPEFSEAVKRGMLLSKAWWEEKGRKATFGGTDGFNATSFIFNMKNRFKEEDELGECWADMRENKHSGVVGVSDMTEAQIDDRLREAVQALQNAED